MRRPDSRAGAASRALARNAECRFERSPRMRALLPLFLLVSPVVGGCQPTPVAAEETAKPESRATAMPASLRCARAADCQPEATCYWSTPSCVAVATAVTQKCEDG